MKLVSKNLVAKPNVSVVLCITLLLSACDFHWPFSERVNYTIFGSSENKELDEYLHQVLEDRLNTKIEKTKDVTLNERRESYRESQITTDFLQAMKAKGYYDGKVTYQDNAEQTFSGKYIIESGRLYTISSVNVLPNAFSEKLERQKISQGDALDAVNVLSVQSKLEDNIQKGKCYFTLKVENAVNLNKNNHTAVLTYNVDAGQEANFGKVNFTGQSTIKTSYLQKLIPWKTGDCYKQSKIENLKTTLLETGLFARADVMLPDQPDSSGVVPVEINLTERAQRTVKAGASYYSDEGLGTSFGWEHRNFFGSAEKMNIDLVLSQLKQNLTAKLNKPYFLRKDQDLSLNIDLRRQDTDAFEEVGIGFGADLTRKFNKYLSGTGGLDFNLTQITDKARSDEPENFYGLVSAPFSLTYDNRNSKLDPNKGWLLAGFVEPFFDAFGESDPFLKTQIAGSSYYAFDRKANYVLAARATMGSILGSGVVNIPPTERFYAGGGGSVRGYGYQEVGPKDESGAPIGGRSAVTGSTEFRIKFTDKIGAVAFMDAGTVSEDSFPVFKNVAVGAGVGMRYYTSFGPLRFDIATPLTEKQDLDQNYQFYISIGQSF